jgi:integrase/recombinase XerD
VSFRAFPVRMPAGGRYWTVLDERLQVVSVADRFLRELRFGQDRAESTTESYARGLVLFLAWCERTGRDWREAAADIGLFITWLKYTPSGDGETAVVLGPGAGLVRSAKRINGVLIATRGFLSFAVSCKEAPGWVLGQLYEIATTADLPMEAQGEDSGLAFRKRARHKLREAERPVDRASDAEITAMFAACRSARDRLIVLLMALVGLRRGEVVGLRRSDIHLLPDSSALGCAVEGSHLHVVRRDNVNKAWAKSRRSRAMPVGFLIVQAFDQYDAERVAVPAAAGSDFVLVNLFREPIGAPMRPDALNELFDALVARAGLDRAISPHMLRHAFGSNLADAGGALDEIQKLMGHARPSSSDPYLHPDPGRLRAAIDRVRTPRLLLDGGA